MASVRQNKRMIGLLAGSIMALLITGCSTPPPPPPPPAYSGPVLPIQQTPRGVEIFLPSSVLFETGKASLNLTKKECTAEEKIKEKDKCEGAAPYLEHVAKLLRKSKNTISLEGHADSVGKPETNQILSEARAKVIEDALAERGVPRERMKSSGFSSNRPRASNATKDGQALNRRVEVIIENEKVETITAGENPNAFENAFDQLKRMIDSGAVKPAEATEKKS